MFFNGFAIVDLDRLVWKAGFFCLTRILNLPFFLWQSTLSFGPIDFQDSRKLQRDWPKAAAKLHAKGQQTAPYVRGSMHQPDRFLKGGGEVVMRPVKCHIWIDWSRQVRFSSSLRCQGLCWSISVSSNLHQLVKGATHLIAESGTDGRSVVRRH